MTERARNDAARRRRRRNLGEARFRFYGIASLAIALGALALLLGSMVAKGYTAFVQTRIALDVALDAQTIDPEGRRAEQAIREANYNTLLRNALYALFPEVTERGDRRVAVTQERERPGPRSV